MSAEIIQFPCKPKFDEGYVDPRLGRRLHDLPPISFVEHSAIPYDRWAETILSDIPLKPA